MNKLPSYPKIYAIGHAAINEIFKSPVIVQEKIDGSQFSFGIINRELLFRSKGAIIIPETPPKMFAEAVEHIQSVSDKLIPNMVYRGEVLQKAKHNTLAYDRVPENHIVLFDIDDGLQNFLSYGDVVREAKNLQIEPVRQITYGLIDSYEIFSEFLEEVSQLGGQKIEGIVVKNYNIFTTDKTVAMGKFVSERFKEVHNSEWKLRNPTKKDIVSQIIENLHSEARWEKAIQHLAEREELDNSPRDIGTLMKEVSQDILSEEADNIKEQLFKHAWKDISRGVTKGLPEWYKERLARSAF